MTTEGTFLPDVSVQGPRSRSAADRMRHALGPVKNSFTTLWSRSAVRSTAIDAGVVLIAVLDVWLIVPENAPAYSAYLSAVSCVALLLRRWFPFTVLLLTIPGFMAGWAQVAAMMALGFLATRKQTHWQVWVGAWLVWMCRFVLWPLPEFAALTWKDHGLDIIYSTIVAGMPLAIGLLIGARHQLATRLAELNASRDRERKLHAEMVRAEERTRLAREMHDVVSHNITLIAMQAGVLTATTSGGESERTARTIRELSTHTLEELRGLVGLLRSGSCEDDGPSPQVCQIPELVRECQVPVRLELETLPEYVPEQVSAAAYRTVQEALTNVRKHAPGADTLVTVHADDTALFVQVRNEPPAARRQSEGALPSGGYGLTGLAERARLLGGTLESSPTAEGGFCVTARYPVQA
ncbi:sensor histidine kinase [Prauserella rugosa]|uniref:histidine kinase n=1 Tax=Prauserella rugosa TaxID=43354 RepID=A0A660CF11_9PSEU|nr:histidine kinase [Prauserella rugosa]KMS87911.1 histidine kinase [Streptomyces regensis]TWH19541.1 signal transduction histidine kinase [Prauserella rugosa]